MPDGRFVDRVSALHDAWAERRDVAHLARDHGYEAQTAILQRLHAWSRDLVADVGTVYGRELSLELSPISGEDVGQPGFSIVLNRRFGADFRLVRRSRQGEDAWHLAVSMRHAGPAGEPVMVVGPERRSGHWTRARLEDVVLSLLGAVERSRDSRGGAQATVAR
jgi:hypothetical protein